MIWISLALTSIGLVLLIISVANYIKTKKDKWCDIADVSFKYIFSFGCIASLISFALLFSQVPINDIVSTNVLQCTIESVNAYDSTTHYVLLKPVNSEIPEDLNNIKKSINGVTYLEARIINYSDVANFEVCNKNDLTVNVEISHGTETSIFYKITFTHYDLYYAKVKSE